MWYPCEYSPFTGIHINSFISHSRNRTLLPRISSMISKLRLLFFRLYGPKIYPLRRLICDGFVPAFYSIIQSKLIIIPHIGFFQIQSTSSFLPPILVHLPDPTFIRMLSLMLLARDVPVLLEEELPESILRLASLVFSRNRKTSHLQ